MGFKVYNWNIEEKVLLNNFWMRKYRKIMGVYGFLVNIL